MFYPNTKSVEVECPHSEFEVYEIIEGSWDGDSFIDIKTIGLVTFITLNKYHQFYNDIYLKNEEKSCPQEREALDLLLVSYARALTKLVDADFERMEQFDMLNQMWRDSMNYFLDRLE